MLQLHCVEALFMMILDKREGFVEFVCCVC